LRHRGYESVANVPDKAAVVHIRRVDIRTDTDNVIGRADAATGSKAHGYVEASGRIVSERINTVSRVFKAGGIAKERGITDSRVEATFRIVEQSLNTVDGVRKSGGIAK
jgi:hypothetical protein